MSSRKKMWLTGGLWTGAAMIVLPFLASAITVATASRVPEGLRGATHIPEMKDKVGFALGSTSLMAILAPPGVLVFVSCGVALAGEQRRRDRAARVAHAGHQGPEAGA
jgi:hypothetical protein